MKIWFKPPAHIGCQYPKSVQCDADVKEWIALEPQRIINPLWLDVEDGFCADYPVGTKQCVTVTIDLIRKHNRYRHRAVYITLPNGDEYSHEPTTTWE